MSAAFDLRARWRAETLTKLHGDVLDVGAGTGDSIRRLTRAARLVLLEPHAAYVRALERQAATRPETRVVRGHAEQIPLDDASFDAVI